MHDAGIDLRPFYLATVLVHLTKGGFISATMKKSKTFNILLEMSSQSGLGFGSGFGSGIGWGFGFGSGLDSKPESEAELAIQDFDWGLNSVHAHKLL